MWFLVFLSLVLKIRVRISAKIVGIYFFLPKFALLATFFKALFSPHAL